MAEKNFARGGRGVARFFGLILMTIGGLIAGLSGLCTLGWVGFLYLSVAPAYGSTNGVDSLMTTTFVVGGLPILFGVGLFLIGRWLCRVSPPRTGSPLLLP